MTDIRPQLLQGDGAVKMAGALGFARVWARTEASWVDSQNFNQPFAVNL